MSGERDELQRMAAERRAERSQWLRDGGRLLGLGYELGDPERLAILGVDSTQRREEAWAELIADACARRSWMTARLARRRERPAQAVSTIGSAYSRGVSVKTNATLRSSSSVSSRMSTS